MTESLLKGPAVFVAVTGPDAHAVVKQVIGHGGTPAQLRNSNPGCVRARYAIDDIDCGAIAALTPLQAFKHLVTFFDESELQGPQPGGGEGLLDGAAVMRSFVEAPRRLHSVLAVAGDIVKNSQLPKVLKMLRHSGFELEALKLLPVTELDDLLEGTASSSPSAAAILIRVARPNAVRKLLTCVGCRADEAMLRRRLETAADSLRAAFDRAVGYTNLGAARNETESEAILRQHFPDTSAGDGDPEVDMEGSRRVARRALSLVETICVVLMPSLVQPGEVDHVLDAILREGYTLVGLRSVVLSSTQAEHYAALNGAANKAGLCADLQGGSAIVLALERTNAVTQFRLLMSRTLQKSYGEAMILSSASLEKARKELAFFFSTLMLGEDRIEAAA